MICASVERRTLSRPPDTSVYAEIRKSTVEPDNSRPANGISRDTVATRAGNHLQPVAAEGAHDSIRDLTLIENDMYKNSAECSRPVRNSYLPGNCSLMDCFFHK